MLINWFTVGAQILNFIILVFLMKRYLYKPILNSISSREKKIADEIADANSKKLQATKDQDEFKKKNDAFDGERADLLKKATDEAAVERQRLLVSATKEVEDLRDKKLKALQSEQQSIGDSITRRTQDEVFSISRKVLKDLAGASLETQMVGVFLSQMTDLNAGEKTNLKGAIDSTTDPILVRSAFLLGAPQQELIENGIKKELQSTKPLRFEIAPNLIAGIELTANGRKVAWTISNYLTSLLASVNTVLEVTPAPKSKTPTQQSSPALAASQATATLPVIAKAHQ